MPFTFLAELQREGTLTHLYPDPHSSDPLQFATQPTSSSGSLADSPAYSLQGIILADHLATHAHVQH
jgi:hypothetical protein